jgi:3-mercaptopyruvate sulfurtransferase SseA
MEIEMKRSVSIVLLTLILMFSLSCKTLETKVAIPIIAPIAAQITTTSEPPKTTLDVARITAGELKQKMDNGDYLILVDARTPKSYESAYLPEARNIPGTPTPMTPVEDIKMLLNLLPVDVLIVFYGDAADDADAAYLGRLLLDNHTGHKFTDIRVLAGGYPGWKAQGNSVRTTPASLICG